MNYHAWQWHFITTLSDVISSQSAYRSLARISVIGSVYGILWTSSPVLNDKNLAEQYGWPALQRKTFTDIANWQRPLYMVPVYKMYSKQRCSSTISKQVHKSVNQQLLLHYNRFTALCPGLPRWASTRKKHSPTHLFWSLSNLYQLLPSTTIHSILPVQFTCLTIFLHKLPLSSLWSTSWSGALHLILHKFLHPISVFFSQHMPIPLQPVLL